MKPCTSPHGHHWQTTCLYLRIIDEEPHVIMRCKICGEHFCFTQDEFEEYQASGGMGL